MLSLPRALPQLSGTWLTAFRILWWPLFVLTLAATVAGLHYERVSYDQRVQPFAELGLRSWGGNSLGTPLGGESRAAGIRAGRRVVAVAGRPLPADASRELLAARLREAPGPVVAITTRGPGDDIRQHRLRRGPHHLDLAFRGIGVGFKGLLSIERGLGFAANLIAILAALLLFRRRARDPVAALLSFAFLGVTAGSGQAFSTLAELGPRGITDILRIAGFGALAVGILTFPSGRFEPRWTLWAAFLTASWVVVGILLVALLPQQTSWTAFNLLGVALIVSSVAALALRYRRVESEIERQQIRWAAFGFTVGGLLGSAVGVIEEVYPSIDDEFLYAWLRLLDAVIAPTAWALLALGLLVSLLRYRLYDADAVISRSAAYAFLTLLLGAAFAGSEKIIEVLGEEMFGESSRALAAGLGAAVAATLVAPLHNRVHRWTERRFQRGLVQLRRRLPTTVGDMREFASLDDLLSTVADEVEKALRATRVAVLIGGSGEPLSPAFARHVATGDVEAWQAAWQPGDAETLDCDRGDPMFPARLRLRADGAGTVGWLLLGPRPDGSFFGKDEREALAEIADPVTRAVHIVRQRASLNASLFGRIHSIESEVAALVKTLASLARPSRI